MNKHIQDRVNRITEEQYNLEREIRTLEEEIKSKQKTLEARHELMRELNLLRNHVEQLLR